MIQFGIARRIITPRWSVHLGGFAHRHEPSTGVHDDLEAKCLSLYDGTDRLVLVVCDLIWVEREICEAVREAVVASHNVAADKIMILGTHTHAGPCELGTARHEVVGETECAYWELVAEAIGEAISEAIKCERPGTAEHAASSTNIAINRRLAGSEGISIGPNRCGPVDRALHVIAIRDEQGFVRGLIVNAACHPTILHANNRRISAEFPGVACRELERAYPGCAALFVQGACADSEPLVCAVGDEFKAERGTYEDVVTAGRLLAHEVRFALQGATPLEHPRFSATVATAQLRCEVPGAEGYYAAAIRGSDPGDYVQQWCAERKAELAAARSLERSVSAEVQRFTLGDSLRIVGVEAEIFAESAGRIRDHCGAGATLIAGYANGCIGYIPPKSAIEEGGYEVDHAAMYYRLPGLLANDAEATLLESVGRCAGGQR